MPRWLERMKQARSVELRKRTLQLPEIRARAAGVHRELDEALQQAGETDAPRLTVSLESLRELERIHLGVVTGKIAISRDVFEELLGLYVGQALVELAHGTWCTIEDPTRIHPPSIGVAVGVGTFDTFSMAARIYKDRTTSRPRREFSRLLAGLLGRR